MTLIPHSELHNVATHPLHAHCHGLPLAPVGNLPWPCERHFRHNVIAQKMTLGELEHKAYLQQWRQSRQLYSLYATISDGQKCLLSYFMRGSSLQTRLPVAVSNLKHLVTEEVTCRPIHNFLYSRA